MNNISMFSIIKEPRGFTNFSINFKKYIPLYDTILNCKTLKQTHILLYYIYICIIIYTLFVEIKTFLKYI